MQFRAPPPESTLAYNMCNDCDLQFSSISTKYIRTGLIIAVQNLQRSNEQICTVHSPRAFLVIIEEIIIVRVRGCQTSQAKTLGSFTTLGAGLVLSLQDSPTVNPEVLYFLSGGPFCSLCTELEAGANLKNWPILRSKMARKMVKQESCPSLLSLRRIQGSL